MEEFSSQKKPKPKLTRFLPQQGEPINFLFFFKGLVVAVGPGGRTSSGALIPVLPKIWALFHDC